MTESDDQLGSLFFYMLVVYPVVSWILHPGRFSKRKAIAYAVLFLAAIATAHVVYDLKDKGMNYYRVLGVTRASPPSVIKKAFKRLSLELHPDKNSSPFAHEQFQLVKHAHDVLMNPDLRSGYDKFGEEGVQIATQMVLDNKQVLIRLLVSYISQAIFSFIMTVSGAGRGR
jgi:preprotein translocase subunit Sec63